MSLRTTNSGYGKEFYENGNVAYEGEWINGNEELGLQYCDICYEYKKGLVDTGCENKHQTCKECLDKLIRMNNAFKPVVCPFCRGYCSKKPVDPHPASYYLMENGEDIRDVWQDRADDMRDRDRH